MFPSRPDENTSLGGGKGLGVAVRAAVRVSVRPAVAWGAKDVGDGRGSVAACEVAGRAGPAWAQAVSKVAKSAMDIGRCRARSNALCTVTSLPSGLPASILPKGGGAEPVPTLLVRPRWDVQPHSAPLKIGGRPRGGATRSRTGPRQRRFRRGFASRRMNRSYTQAARAPPASGPSA